jgi:hypothetical protein
MLEKTLPAKTILGQVKRRGRPNKKHVRRHIPLPDGSDELWPREELAELIGCSPRTIQKLKLPVTAISNVGYSPKNMTIAAYIEAHTRHPPEPPTKARARRRR